MPVSSISDSSNNQQENTTKFGKIKNWFNSKKPSSNETSIKSESNFENSSPALASISENIDREILYTKIILPLEKIISGLNFDTNTQSLNQYGLYGIKLDIEFQPYDNVRITIRINKLLNTSTSSLLETNENDVSILIDTKILNNVLSINSIDIQPHNDSAPIPIFPLSNIVTNLLNQINIDEISRLFIEYNPNAEMLNEYSLLMGEQQAEIAKNGDTSSRIANIKSDALGTGLDIEELYLENIKSYRSESEFHTQKEYVQMVEKQIKKDAILIEWTTRFMNTNTSENTYVSNINNIQNFSKHIIKNSSSQNLDDQTINSYQLYVDDIFRSMGLTYSDAKYLKAFIENINLENITIRELTDIINLELQIAYFGEDILRELTPSKIVSLLALPTSTPVISNQFVSSNADDTEDERYLLLQSIGSIYSQIIDNGSVKFLDRFKYKTEKLRLLRYLRINKEYKEIWM